MLKKIIFCLCLISIVFPSQSQAIMSSTNYFIYSDDVNFNGGQYSSGTSYVLFDTAGESPSGFSTSSSYIIKAGFQSQERGSLDMTLSSSAVSLGTLSTSAVNSASVTAYVTTNSNTGYNLTIGAVSGTMPAAVSDGTVTAGSEEYGFSASGTNTVISGDVAVTNGLTVSATQSAVVSDATTLLFKASQSSGSTAGSYSQTITLSVSANFN